MKILFFIECLHSGGKERRLVELIKGLSTNPDIEMELVLTKEEIHYKSIFLTNIKIHYTVRKIIKKDPSIFYKFYKIAKKFNPDIIHVWGNLVAVYAIPAKIILRIPIINNQIGDASLKVSRSILGHKLTFPFSDKIIANSYAGLKAYNAPVNKSMVIYNGFDFKRIYNLDDHSLVRKKFNISSKFVVGMVASFSDYKDYSTYIEAAKIVLNKNADVTFLCIGAGDASKYKMIVSGKNSERILFLGRQDNVESIMNICDIGILATYTEGISNALLEFSALGKPIITNYGGGNIELVSQGKTGFLINQSAPNELADKILFFINNEKERINFGLKGKKRIEKEFSIEKMIEEFSKTFDEVILKRK